MKEGRRRRIREAAPSAGRGEGPRSSSSLPSSFKCPRQSAARPLFAGAHGVAGRPLSSSRVCRRASARSLKCPRGCLFSPRVGLSRAGQGRRAGQSPGWATGRAMLAKAGEGEARKCGKVLSRR